MNKPRVILADDHTFVLEGFKKLLEEQCDLVGSVEDGRALVEAAVKLQPDLVILDISMPRLNGIEAAKKLKVKLGDTVHVVAPFSGVEAMQSGKAPPSREFRVTGVFYAGFDEYDKRLMYEESLRMPFLVRWPAGIKPGTTSGAIGINCDFAPTFLELAGQPTPAEMQGRSFLPLWKGRKPGDWRQAMYYRYYHDPGDHNTRAHYGVRTATHKLIYFWKKDQWECYDLMADPQEMHNIYNDPKAQKTVASLKQELYRLKKEVKDDDQFADKQPPPGVDGVLLRGPGKKGAEKK